MNSTKIYLKRISKYSQAMNMHETMKWNVWHRGLDKKLYRILVQGLMNCWINDGQPLRNLTVVSYAKM